MKRFTKTRYLLHFSASLLLATQVGAQQPTVDSQPPEVDTALSEERSAVEWKPSGLASPRNHVVFRPSKDGSLRSMKNANLGDNGIAAATDQTIALRTLGMPKHLKVYFDPQTNGFYIAAKPDEAKAASVPAATPPPVTTPPVPNLVISEFFVPSAKLVDATKRTIGLPSGTVTTVPLDLWHPNKLLNTTEGPVQLPLSLVSALPPSNLPNPGLRATDWKPNGVRSSRNQLTFRPSSDGTLRSGRNANLTGGNGVEAAKDQTSVLRGQGMPRHLEVHYDRDTNGFYIAPKP